MNDNFILEDITALINTVLERLGMRLYDLSYNQVSRTLTVFIDRECAAITVGNCREVSNLIAQELNSLDIFNAPYTLEVSSPGIERPLKRPEHYKWAIGKLIEIDAGSKKIRGYLRNIQEDGVVVGTESGESLIPYVSISKAKVIEEIIYGKRR